MKMALADRPIERIATSKTESQFTIKATGKAFKILSSGLYKEKILAIVRELSCNAYDAHVAAGTPDRPFDIHLPNAMEPFFSVRDYGPALSPSQIGPVYTTYFESTKTDSNDLIGGLGLGSKSPFCYVDSFIVISRFEGVRRTYTCFFDENDTPSLLLMSEEESDEETGLEVKLPVRPINFYEFKAKAEQVYRHFEVVPNVGGNAEFKINKADIILVGRGYRLRSEYARRSFAMMGVVAYPIDTNAVPALTADQIKFLNSSALDIEFGIGDLDITAGREELSYDVRTQAAIVKRTEEVMRDITDRVIKRMAECKTEFEARKLHGQLASSGYVLHGFPDAKVPFKGKLINSDRWALNLAEYPGLAILKFTERQSSGRGAARYDAFSGQSWRATDRFYIPAHDNLTVIVDDINGRYIAGRVREFRENNRNASVYVLRKEEIAPPKPKKVNTLTLMGENKEPEVIEPYVPDNTDYIEKIKETLDGVEVMLLSDLERPVAGPRTSTGISTMDEYYRNHYSHFGREAWKVGPSPSESEEGVYIGTTSGVIMMPNGDREEDFSGFFRSIVGMNLWKKSDLIYSIPKTLQGPYVASPTWTNLYDLIKEKLLKATSAPGWKEQASRQRAVERFSKEYPSLISDYSLMLAIAEKIDASHPMASFVKQWGENKHQPDVAAQLALADRMRLKLPASSKIDLVGSWRDLNTKYPLISHLVNTSRYDRNVEKLSKDLSDYIRAMDGTNCQS